MDKVERDAIIAQAKDVDRISWDAVSAIYCMNGMRESDPDGHMAASMATIIARAIAREEIARLYRSIDNVIGNGAKEV